MTRRFVRKINPNIKELVEEEQCGCGNRMLPYLMKTAVEPCTETRVTGSLLTDGGAESAQNGLGPGTTDFPYFDAEGEIAWISGEDASALIADGLIRFAYRNNNYTDSRDLTVSTTDPYAGTKHLSWLSDYDQAVMFVERESCGNVGNRGFQQWASCRANPGDLLTVSAYMKKTGTADTRARFRFEFFTPDYTFISLSEVTEASAITTSYVQYQHSFVAPTETYWVQAWIQSALFSGSGSYVYADTMSLSVT